MSAALQLPLGIADRLAIEADLCRNEGAEDTAALLDAARTSVEELYAKVEIAATIFEEYGRLHRAKLHDGTPSGDYIAFVKKAERNEAYAREMNAALAKARGEQVPA